MNSVLQMARTRKKSRENILARIVVSKHLFNYSFKQETIADYLGVNQSQVSRYIKNSDLYREEETYIDFCNEVSVRVDDYAKEILKNLRLQ